MANKPLTSTEDLDLYYDDRYMEGYMEEWDEAKKNKVKEIVSGLSLPPTGKVLDFGCGNGVFSNMLKQVLPNWEIFGVEISNTAITNAKRKFPQCTFFSVAESDKYRNEFDFLFSHHVIEHVENLEETFGVINSYLKPASFQLHILPCGNEGSYEHQLCLLKKNGIEKDKNNRFYFEEPGHLRRLTTAEFELQENKIGFKLINSFYANQYFGAINWITKGSPRFVKKLTSGQDATDIDASKKLSSIRKKLLLLTYLQFPYSKYWEINSKWVKKIKDYLVLTILFLPALISKYFYKKIERKANEEWENRKKDMNGSEMYLVFKR